MTVKFKPLAGQVVVVSGAASPLGLEVARLAAKAGASVVLAAADEQSVRAAAAEIGNAGGRAHPVAADAAGAEGCDRVARAAAARFGRVDSWIDAGLDAAALAHAAKALALHLGDREDGVALVGFGARMSREARAELKAAKGRIVATLVKLPKDWGGDSPVAAAAQAALHAVAKPMGVMAVAAKGKGLSAATEARKHPGVLLGLGLVAAGAALWFTRGRIAGAAAQAASAARPTLAKAVRPTVVGAVRRRPLAAAKLAMKHPKGALKLAKALR